MSGVSFHAPAHALELRRPSLPRSSFLAAPRPRAPHENKLSKGCDALRCIPGHRRLVLSIAPPRACRLLRQNTRARTDNGRGFLLAATDWPAPSATVLPEACSPPAAAFPAKEAGQTPLDPVPKLCGTPLQRHPSRRRHKPVFRAGCKPPANWDSV